MYSEYENRPTSQPVNLTDQDIHTTAKEAVDLIKKRGLGTAYSLLITGLVIGVPLSPYTDAWEKP